MRGLADTTLFVARESGRRVDEERIPAELAVSIITIGELRAGVLAAGDLETRDLRLATLADALDLDPVPIDQIVAAEWARLMVALRDAGQRMTVNDSWIAATAMALGVPVVTQDDDFPHLADLDIIRV